LEDTLPSAAGKMLPFKKKVNIRNTMNNLKNHGSDIAAYIKEFKMKKKKKKNYQQCAYPLDEILQLRKNHLKIHYKDTLI
jgi:hypothetical protein